MSAAATSYGHARHEQTQPVEAARVIERLLRFDEPGEVLHQLVLAEMCRVGRADAGALLDADAWTPAAPDQPLKFKVRAAHPHAGVAEPPAWITDAIQVLGRSDPSRGAMVRSLPSGKARDTDVSPRHVIYLPLSRADGRPCLGLFLLTTRNLAIVQSSLQLLHAATSLYTLYDVQQSTHQTLAGARHLTAAVAVLSAVQQETRFRAAAMAWCNQVQSAWRASRVSFGILHGHAVKLAAMSGTEHLSRKTALAQAIESAMEECVDQQVEVAFPPPPEGDDAMVVARQAEALSQTHGPSRIVSVPLWVAGDVVGVLTIERSSDAPMLPGAGEAELPGAGEALRLACNLVAPSLLQLRDNDRWLAAKAVTSVRTTAALLVGPRHTWVKLGTLAGCALLTFLIFFRGPDRVTASFVIEATERRLLTAPFDGYLEAVHVAPGDEVASGGVLAELETAELRLGAAQLDADRLRYEKEAGIARRQGEIAEQQANEAEAARVQAELDLVRYQIERAHIVSALPGVVLEGDHRRRIGGAVQKGDTLFELAPPEELKAELYVPEERVGELRVGERGELASASHPGDFIAFTIERIEPAAIVKDERNVFRVHAALADAPPWLRPGMAGVAKVEVGRASYLRLWTRDAVNWVRMKLWM